MWAAKATGVKGRERLEPKRKQGEQEGDDGERKQGLGEMRDLTSKVKRESEMWEQKYEGAV